MRDLSLLVEKKLAREANLRERQQTKRAYKAIDHLQQALAIIQSFEDPKNLYALNSVQRAIDSILRHNTKS